MTDEEVYEGITRVLSAHRATLSDEDWWFLMELRGPYMRRVERKRLYGSVPSHDPPSGEEV